MLKFNRKVKKSKKNHESTLFNLPLVIKSEFLSYLSMKEISYFATLSKKENKLIKEDKAIILNVKNYRLILKGQIIFNSLIKGLNLSQRIKKIIKTKIGFMALGKNLISVEDFKDSIEPTCLKAILNENGITALEEKLIPLEYIKTDTCISNCSLRAIFNPVGLQLIRDNFISYKDLKIFFDVSKNLKTMLTKNGQFALRQGLAKSKDMIKMNNDYLEVLLSDEGLEELKNGSIEFLEAKNFNTVDDLKNTIKEAQFSRYFKL